VNLAPDMDTSGTSNVPLVSIIIPTFNRKKELLRLLNSIAMQEYPTSRLEIIVVDDHSQDGTADVVKDTFPNVHIYSHDRERWVSAARNTGISKSKGEFLLFIDDDNVTDPKCIRELLSTFENPNNTKIGLVGPLMYYLEKPDTVWCAGIKRDMITSQTHFVGRNEVDHGQFTQTTQSDDFPNCFMISRKALDAAGPFDQKNFPINYEESDIARRVQLSGYDIILNPSAKVWHDIEPPRPGKSQNRLYHLGGPFRAYYISRNRIIFQRKYSGRREFAYFVTVFLWLFTLFYIRIIIMNSDVKISDRLGIASGYLRGVVDGLSNKIAPIFAVP
jgi:GT2 family glycosyltransferase